MDLQTAARSGGAIAAPEQGPSRRRLRWRRRESLPRWWQEGLVIAAFYAVYTVIRDLQTGPGGAARAMADGIDVAKAERWLGIWHERGLQLLFITHRGLMQIWDSYYGTAHFLLVIFVLLILYFRDPGRYRQWRNTLAVTTGLALIGFAVFPVAPPRLLPPPYHLVDSLLTIGGFWDFYHGPIAQVSNQFAAMPSLHTAWSSWCVLAVRPLVRPRWGKALLALYPLATVVCIVVTGNHFFLDAVGGLVTLGLAAAVCRPRRRVPSEAVEAECVS